MSDEEEVMSPTEEETEEEKTAVVGEKRGRGRPRKDGAAGRPAPAYVPTGRPRGRPKKVAKEPYNGKPRGRPKKSASVPAEEAVVSEEEAVSGDEAPEEQAEEDVVPQKKSRGRPKKS